MSIGPTLLLLFISVLSGSPADLDHFYNLEYDEAIAGFRRSVAEAPDSLQAHNELAQGIFYCEMFRAGVLESELVMTTKALFQRPQLHLSAEDRQELGASLRRVLELGQKRVEENGNDVEALYQLGVAHALRANYSFLVRKAWMDGLRHATVARRLHRQVLDLDATFVDANLIQGGHDYLISYLPRAQKVLGFLIGFRGDRQGGIQTIEEVARSGKRNRVSAQMLLTVIYRREKRPEAAVPLLLDLIRKYPRNYLFRLELAQMYGDLRDEAKALAVLDELEAAREAGAPAMARLTAAKLHYVRGTIQFRCGDLDAASISLTKATDPAANPDALNIATAWLWLGQIADLKEQREQAMQAYQNVISLAPNSDLAKESRAYLSSPFKRRES